MVYRSKTYVYKSGKTSKSSNPRAQSNPRVQANSRAQPLISKVRQKLISSSDESNRGSGGGRESFKDKNQPDKSLRRKLSGIPPGTSEATTAKKKISSEANNNISQNLPGRNGNKGVVLVPDAIDAGTDIHNQRERNLRSPETMDKNLRTTERTRNIPDTKKDLNDHKPAPKENVTQILPDFNGTVENRHNHASRRNDDTEYRDIPRPGLPQVEMKKRNSSTLRENPRYSTGYDHVHSYDSREDLESASFYTYYTNSTLDFSVTSTVDRNSVYSNSVDDRQAKKGVTFNKSKTDIPSGCMADNLELGTVPYPFTCQPEQNPVSKLKTPTITSGVMSFLDYDCGNSSKLSQTSEFEDRRSKLKKSKHKKTEETNEKKTDGTNVRSLDMSSCQADIPSLPNILNDTNFAEYFLFDKSCRTISKTNQKTISVMLFFLLLLLFWTFQYMLLEQWTFVNSLYFMVQVVTTIGFGDVVPVTLLGMIMFPICSFLGIGLAVITSARIAICTNISCKFVTTKRMFILLVCIFLLFGAVFVQVEKWSVWEAIYFMYSCASLTGLYDRVPETTLGKLSFCIFMGLLIQTYTIQGKLLFNQMRYIINERERPQKNRELI